MEIKQGGERVEVPIVKARKVADGFIFKPKIGTATHIEVGGNPLTFDRYRPSPVQVKALEDVRAFRSRRTLSHYAAQETDLDDLTVEEWRARERELTTCRTWNEASESWSWPDLDSEFAFRRFGQKWKAKHVEVLDPVPFQWEVFAVPEIENPYITAIAQVGGDTLSPFVSYSRTAALRALIREEAARLGLKFTEKSMNQAPGELKMYEYRSDETSLFGSRFSRAWTSKSFSGELSEALAAYERDAQVVRTALSVYANATVPSSEIIPLSDLLSGLNALRSQFAAVHSKKATYSKQRSAMESLRELIARIEARVAKHSPQASRPQPEGGE